MCFYIERELRKRMNIPVFHDDQHGTAIITAAALLNALIITEKKIDEIKIVCSGAGAAAISCLDLICALGAKKKTSSLPTLKALFQRLVKILTNPNNAMPLKPQRQNCLM